MKARRSIENRRAAYRVRPESVHELDLAILEKRYRVVRGAIADVAIGGAQAQFETDALDAPAEGERVLLALASESYDFDCTLWARVVASDGAGQSRSLSFSFEDEKATLAAGNERFFALFNRRASYRHPVSGGDTTPGALIAPRRQDPTKPGGVAATVADLSSAGVGLRLTPDAEQALVGHDDLTLSLRLAGFATPQYIPCRVCHRGHQDGSPRYGCAFEWPPGAAGRAVAEALATHVRERLAKDKRLAPDRRKQAF